MALRGWSHLGRSAFGMRLLVGSAQCLRDHLLKGSPPGSSAIAPDCATPISIGRFDRVTD